MDRDAYLDDLLELIARWVVEDLQAERNEGEAYLIEIKIEQQEESNE